MIEERINLSRQMPSIDHTILPHYHMQRTANMILRSILLHVAQSADYRSNNQQLTQEAPPAISDAVDASVNHTNH